MSPGEILEATRTAPVDCIALSIRPCETGGQLTLARSAPSTCPLFISSNAGIIEGTWDNRTAFSKVASEHLNKLEISRMVDARAPTSIQTISKNIISLSERMSVTYTSNEYRIDYPDRFEGFDAGLLRDTGASPAIFRDLIRAVTMRWDAGWDDTAFEISGGLDSGSVAHACAPLFRDRMKTCGMTLPGSMGQTQGMRRTCLMPPGSSDFPFHVHNSDTAHILPNSWMPYDDYIGGMQDQQNSELKRNQIKYVVSGIGGDELFPSTRPRKLANKSTYLTPDAASALDEHAAIGLPRPVLPFSSTGAASCRAPHFLRHGIWPLNPMCAPELVEFCHRLPDHLREKRMLAILAMEANGISCFSQAYQKETFTRLQDTTLRAMSVEFMATFQDSALADLGIINIDRFISNYRKFLSGQLTSYPDLFIMPLQMERYLKNNI